MALPAFLDTCTLFGIYLADTLLRLAEAGTYRPMWSADVLDELRRNLLDRGLPPSAVNHRIAQMRAAFPEAEVAGYQPLIPAMACEEKDRHVLAAAVRENADLLVTFNTRDFPDASVAPYEIAVVHPDDFLLDQLDLHPEEARRVMSEQVAAYQNPPLDLPELLELLTAAGVPRFAAAVRRDCPDPSE